MSKVKEPCGCKHDHHRWLEFCAAHLLEFTETHARWHREHVERYASEQRNSVDSGNGSP